MSAEVPRLVTQVMGTEHDVTFLRAVSETGLHTPDAAALAVLPEPQRAEIPAAVDAQRQFVLEEGDEWGYALRHHTVFVPTCALEAGATMDAASAKKLPACMNVGTDHVLTT